ncbi:VOC family protein [Streptomyces sp. NPDC004244]|uniref:VOC family protein n=1 Tax=Streptomyces sp. NPDC101206 TaxID=3366128 RepID=UPI003821711D
MDALHPRLLVDRFGAAFEFYDATLPALLGASRTRGGEQGPYAGWDVDGQGVLALFDRAAMPAGLPLAPTGGDPSMLVSRVTDVDAGYALCLDHGAEPVAEPQDRPAWGPGLRTAHVRAPGGTLWELQSYPG